MSNREEKSESLLELREELDHKNSQYEKLRLEVSVLNYDVSRVKIISF